MLGFLFPVPHKSSWFLHGFPSCSQQKAPGNNLKPGRFPRGVTDAGAETDENAPHPWETFSSVAETGHWWCFLTLPWLSEPWELRFLLSQITLPHPALAPRSPCSRHPLAARGELTLAEKHCFALGWPNLPVVNPSPPCRVQSQPTHLFPLRPLNAPLHFPSSLSYTQEAREWKEGWKLFSSGEADCREWKRLCLHFPFLRWAEGDVIKAITSTKCRVMACMNQLSQEITFWLSKRTERLEISTLSNVGATHFAEHICLVH